jgi:hypothetical protein
MPGRSSRAVAHQPLGRGYDSDAQAVHHLRQIILTAKHSPARTADSLDPVDHWLTLKIFQGHQQRLFTGISLRDREIS